MSASLSRCRAARRSRPSPGASRRRWSWRYLEAGLLDELVLHLVPAVLGAGERLYDGLDGLRLEPVEVIASPTVTHLRYRVVR